MNKWRQLKLIAHYLFFLSGFKPLMLFASSKKFFHYYWVRKFSPEEIMLYNMAHSFFPQNEEKNIFSNEEYLVLQKKLNPLSSIILTESKIKFNQHCIDHQLPTPVTYCSILKGLHNESTASKIAEIEAAIQQLPNKAFVIKPSNGTHGEGIHFFTKHDHHFRVNNITKLSLSNFIQFLISFCQGRDYLIQEKTQHHKTIQKMFPSNALQTLRFNTLVINNKCHILFCEFRQAGNSMLTDNFNTGKSGSILWTVNLVTGVITKGFQVKQKGYGANEIPPPSFICELPFWQETLSLVKAASKAFEPLKTIGWDIAITNTGPLLLEANSYFDPINFMSDFNQVGVYQLLEKTINEVPILPKKYA